MEKIYKESGAIMMAIGHFNSGDGRVVTELENIDRRCRVRLTTNFHDTQYTPSVVVQSLTDQLLANGGGGGGGGGNPEETRKQRPCAVIGARTSSSTMPMATVSSAYGVPQMSYTATSPTLNDRFKYSHFQRVVPSDDAAAKAAVKFLREVASTTHAAVLHIDDSFGNGYARAFQDEAFDRGVVARAFPLAFPPDVEDVRRQLRKLKSTGMRHVLLVAFTSYIEDVMVEAYRMGIAGSGGGGGGDDGDDCDGGKDEGGEGGDDENCRRDGNGEYFWMLGMSTTHFDGLNVKKDSEIARAVTGMGVLPEFGSKPKGNSPGYGRFLDAWNALGANDVSHFNSKLPKSIRGVEDCYEADPDFFSSKYRDDPGSTAHFAYDTVVSIGLGACAAALSSSDGVRPSFNGTQHTRGITNAMFDGATGIVRIDPTTLSRDPLLFSYSVLNVVPDDGGGGGSSGNVTFEMRESIILQPSPALDDDGWDGEEVGWTVVRKTPFIFPGGTRVPPPSLPPIEINMNYIGDGLRAFGLAVYAVVMCASIGFALWTYVSRKINVVKASQPPFLIMVCVGIMVLASTLVPLSIDDERFDQRATDIACMSQPWLASLGFVTAFSGKPETAAYRGVHLPKSEVTRCLTHHPFPCNPPPLSCSLVKQTLEN